MLTQSYRAQWNIPGTYDIVRSQFNSQHTRDPRSKSTKAMMCTLSPPTPWQTPGWEGVLRSSVWIICISILWLYMLISTGMDFSKLGPRLWTGLRECLLFPFLCAWPWFKCCSFVNQCPIPPNNTFDYAFSTAQQSGKSVVLLLCDLSIENAR